MWAVCISNTDHCGRRFTSKSVGEIVGAALNGRGDAILDLASPHTLREILNVGKSEVFS